MKVDRSEEGFVWVGFEKGEFVRHKTTEHPIAGVVFTLPFNRSIGIYPNERVIDILPGPKAADQTSWFKLPEVVAESLNLV